MNQLQIFNFEKQEVRTILIENEPYFVANDVARTLGYVNASDATNKHCKKSIKIWGSDSLGRRQEFKVIPESDVYRLVFRSKLPEAERFEDWVTSDVLPSIRKTGGFGPVSNTKLLLKASLEHEEKLETLSEDVGMLKETMRIDGSQEFQIKSLGNKKVISCLGGYDSPAYKELAEKVYARFWRDFKQYFVIPRYGELPRSKFSEAMEFIDEWSPETEMRMKIKLLNNQTHLQLVNEKGD